MAGIAPTLITCFPTLYHIIRNGMVICSLRYKWEIILHKHGIKRTKVDPAAIAARREKEKEKLKAYLESEKQILDLVGIFTIRMVMNT